MIVTVSLKRVKIGETLSLQVQLTGRNLKTQFGRLLDEPGIESIPAGRIFLLDIC
jgi:hypothetical protein